MNINMEWFGSCQDLINATFFRMNTAATKHTSFSTHEYKSFFDRDRGIPKALKAQWLIHLHPEALS